MGFVTILKFAAGSYKPALTPRPGAVTLVMKGTSQPTQAQVFYSIN